MRIEIAFFLPIIIPAGGLMTAPEPERRTLRVGKFVLKRTSVPGNSRNVTVHKQERPCPGTGNHLFRDDFVVEALVEVRKHCVDSMRKKIPSVVTRG